MLLLIFLVFQLFVKVQPQTGLTDQSWLTMSPASVFKESDTVQPKHDRPKDAMRSNENHTMTVISQYDVHFDERPTIRVIHESQLSEFRIYCEIPRSDNGSYNCYIFSGDQYKYLIKTVSVQISGKTNCIFTITENVLFNHMKSAKSKSLSCKYSLKTAPLNHSQYSDKYNLTAFLPVQNQSPSTTKRSTLSAGMGSSSCLKTTINPMDRTPQALHPVSITWNTTTVLKSSTPGKGSGPRTPKTRTWLIIALAATSGGIALIGLMGICICCFTTKKPRIQSRIRSSAPNQHPAETENNEDHSEEENKDNVYHVYCTIPEISADSHEFYSLTQMPNQPLPI
ncbi:uncharacterized protein LOC127426550 [Myxocyprinus asiaticus]|uniref:uncharacterized protein LOC127426550 n=1 Tax=Myxocyprinus asiaticus TaxID=70543 RepID=UPI0022217D22|nr:uncharacterized protein LOC127426550 [Myxocyprinus asiaticus]